MLWNQPFVLISEHLRLLGLFITLFITACSSPVHHELDVEDKRVVQIMAVGDIMLGTDFPKDTLPPDNLNILAQVSPILQQADITFGNLEGVLLDGGEPVKKCKTLSSCYLFRTPLRYVKNLQEAGFDVMSLANNHARDFGEEGRDSSMQALTEAGIYHSGRIGDVARWQVKGLKVAMIAFAPFGNSHDMLDIEKAVQQVTALAKDHAIVMVSIHAGAEGLDATHLPFDTEFYHGEDRGDSVKFARAVIEAGADLVLGHGPHVPRAIELYQGRLIAYSLGNFCTHWGISVAGIKGLAPILRVNLSSNGAFLSGKIISARQQRPEGPMLDENHTVARLIQQLTEEDFPDTALKFDSVGNISIDSKQGHHIADK